MVWLGSDTHRHKNGAADRRHDYLYPGPFAWFRERARNDRSTSDRPGSDMWAMEPHADAAPRRAISHRWLPVR